MNQLLLKHKDSLITLCKTLNIQRMNIFGSIVTEKFNDNSDIDFLVKFSTELSGEEYSDNYFELHYKLREIFNREIDVITEKSLSNPFFIKSINKSKVLIYEA